MTFSKPILDARVVMGPVTGNGSDPVVARVRNVTDTGFEIQLDEWDYLDGWHTKETVSWVAGSAGTHTLENGQTVSFGRTTLQDDASAQVALSGFSKTPAVFAQVTSANDAAAVTQRINAVTAGGFTMRIQEEEAADQRHAAETVDWLAIDYGTAGALDAGLATASHRSATVSFDAQAGVPVFLAAQQTRNGGDTAAVRLKALGGTGATFAIEEEKSRDTETGHVDEQVAYLSLAAGTVLDLAAHVPPAVPSLSFVVSADGPSGTGAWVDKDASADVSPGDMLTYTYTLANDGNVALTNVTLSDAIAPGLSAAALSGLTDTDGDGLADDLAVGTVATATYRYTVMAGDGGKVLTSVATAATTETAARSATLTQMVANPAPVVNTPPEAVDDRVATGYGAPLALDAADLLANDGDADGDPLSLVGVRALGGGSVTRTGDAIVFTPAAGFEGAATFEYSVSDGIALSTATVSVAVASAGYSASLLAMVPEGVGLADPSLAVGLAGFSYWKSPPFLNLMKQAAMPGIRNSAGDQVALDELVTGGYLDENGYPVRMYEGNETLPGWQQGYDIYVSIHHENESVRQETRATTSWNGWGPAPFSFSISKSPHKRHTPLRTAPSPAGA